MLSGGSSDGAGDLAAKIAAIAAASKKRAEAGEAIFGDPQSQVASASHRRRVKELIAEGIQPDEARQQASREVASSSLFTSDHERGFLLAQAAAGSDTDSVCSGDMVWRPEDLDDVDERVREDLDGLAYSDIEEEFAEFDSRRLETETVPMEASGRCLRGSLARISLVLEKLLTDPGARLKAKDLQDTLMLVRPAADWALVVREVRKKLSPTSPEARATATAALLSLLHGRLTLHEALSALGSAWAAATEQVRGLAQWQLTWLCSDACSDAERQKIPLEGLLRGGAGLLSADARGRLPVHRAAATGSPGSLALLARLLHFAPTTLIVEDDEGCTPLEVIAQTPLFQKAASANDGTEAIILTAGSRTKRLADDANQAEHDHEMRRVPSDHEEPVLPGGRILAALADAALSCAAALPAQTARLLQQSPDAARAWKTLASAGGGRAALLLAAGDLDEGLSKIAEQAEVREGQQAARLRQGMQRVLVLQSLVSKHEQQTEDLEPHDLKLQLAHAKQLAEQQAESFAKAQASAEQELRQLRRSLAEKEEQLLLLASSRRQDDTSCQQCVREDVCDSNVEQQGKQEFLDDRMLSDQAKRSFASEERAIVEQIRRSRLVGVDAQDLPKDLWQGVQEMQRSLAAAVDRLARDLYESQAHFVQELIQNADDNMYADGVSPRLELVLRSRRLGSRKPYFFAANNELGLTEADANAICDISRSSKSQASGSTTGYKGVGWKSVFRVCEEPHVLSQGWRFKFSSKGLGMLTPSWLAQAEYEALPEDVREAHERGLTVFYLPLADPGESVPSIRAEMQAIDTEAAQLLFLRRLREIYIRGGLEVSPAAETDADETVARVSILNAKSSSSPCSAATVVHERLLLPLSSTGSGPTQATGRMTSRQETKFTVYSHQDVSVALPFVEEPQPQRVFAFLPVRSVGFRFAVQAPFHLTASRADLHRSSDNLRRRDAVAPAFIGALRCNPEIAAHALRYLGTEPAEAFWLSVRQNILQELQGFACVMPEDGGIAMEPGHCLLRGSMPAASWLSNELLGQVCDGMCFVDAGSHGPNGLDALRDLGVRDFGFNELVACVRYEDGYWLQCLWQKQEKRAAAFSDVFASLAEAILEEPDRLQDVQSLRAFPAADGVAFRKSLSKIIQNEVCLCTCEGLHTALCEGPPRSWQLPLVRCLETLQLSPRGLRLLQLLDIKPIDESELEVLALRTVLRLPSAAQADVGMTAASSSAMHDQLWAALAVLRRSFLLGRPGPAPGWEQLQGSVELLSHSGELVPPPQLRLWSFLGVELRLPADIIRNICSIAGTLPHKTWSAHGTSLERAHLPPSSLEQDAPPAEWNLGWEVFLCRALGCQPADPMGPPQASGLPVAEGFLEVKLQLGQLLGAGEFWQRVSRSPLTFDYVKLALLKQSTAVGTLPTDQLHARLNWIRRLCLRSSSETCRGEPGWVTLEDLFVKEVFQSLGGRHLQYISSAPEEPQIRSILKSFGIATEMDQPSLLKALRYLRDNDVQDAGLAADIYKELHKLGFPGPGEKRMVLVPGQGYLHAGDCVWKPFKSQLLRRCCRLEALSEHYSRFGPDVRAALEGWVRPSPDEDAAELCDALMQAILCARASPARPHRLSGKPMVMPDEAAEGLLEASKAAIEALVNICVGRVGVRPGDVRQGTVAFDYFVQHRMIVIPSEENNCRLLAMGEAFWEVAPELEGSPAAALALKKHYGHNNVDAARMFFTEVLRVRPVLTVSDLHRMAQSQLPTVAVPSQGQHGNDHGTGGGGLEEGLDFQLFANPHSQRPSQFDPASALDEAYRRISSMPPPSEGVENHAPEVSSTAGPRVWTRVGFVGERTSWIPVFSAAAEYPPMLHLPENQVLLIWRLCSKVGLHPEQIAFGYDPSGRPVCEERLFLNLTHVARAVLLEGQTAWETLVVFWSGKLARIVAQQGCSSASAGCLSLLKNHLLQLILPRILRTELQGNRAGYAWHSQGSQ
eukprot:TRINITY_DN16877_c0_g1_i2.p1 TRINITY_DN16877_c0_g1~~TRINITY_DN16877_c0_g1_i2.p1  ORF type:complete len:1975 (+),score=405.78 TRINITY_DN16877_c0_g1_i2:265-6189(+)